MKRWCCSLCFISRVFVLELLGLEHQTADAAAENLPRNPLEDFELAGEAAQKNQRLLFRKSTNWAQRCCILLGYKVLWV